jgi:lysophospholipase L1-like esterase
VPEDVVAMRRLSILLTLLATLVVGVPGAAQAGNAVPAGLPASMAAAGDSISRAYDATLWGCFLADCPANSWATGSSSTVKSHFYRARAAQPGVSVTATNVAKTGAKMADLSRQLGLVGANVQYVTVLLGANDVCTSSLATMTPTATFRSQFDGALSAFFAGHPTSFVFVSSIPNVRQLYELFKNNSSARSTWRSFGICQSMLSSSITDDVRAQVQAREVEYNNALAAVCAAYDRCRWDNNATYTTAFTTADVSTIDYFHPSIAGQAKLARITWAASYWPTR